MASRYISDMSSLDYSLFAAPDFNPNEYANSILSSEPVSDSISSSKSPAHLRGFGQDSVAKEDISVAISKLTFGIEDVSKQIKNLVTAHHEELLIQASNANALSGTLASVRSGLNDLEISVEKLRGKVQVPNKTLQILVKRLHKYQEASDFLRRTSRFVTLARRLQAHMNEIRGIKDSQSGDGDDMPTNILHGRDTEDEKDRAIAKAALTLSELASLLAVSERKEEHQDEDEKASSLNSIKIVAASKPFVEDARSLITTEMENMVLRGLTTLNQGVIASAFQTAYNLRVLANLVQSLLFDLSQAVEERIRSTFDLNKISKDVAAKDPLSATNPASPQAYKSRIRTEPTNITAPQFSAALWTRLEIMFQEMADCCIKVYVLERVLKVKKDTTTHIIFMDEAMKLLENTPSATFWIALRRSLEKQFQDSSKSSSFMQQTLTGGYPRLLRLFHDFFAKIAVYTDTVYTDALQSPEAILLLRSISSIETLYTSKSSNKINESLGQTFSGGARIGPGSSEGTNLARVVVNEIDAARFDPLLVKAVAKNTASCLDVVLTKLDGMVTRDRSATSLTGTQATPQQVANANLANFAYQVWTRLAQLKDERGPAIYSSLESSIKSYQTTYENIVDPLNSAIRRELSAIIAKLHRIDFAKSVEPGMSGTSLYIKEFTEKISFIKAEILGRYNLGDVGRTWVISIIKYVMRTFVLHISIAFPLGESGKLQIASDMTQLEFALNSFIADSTQNRRRAGLESIGAEYRAIRAMRPLFFLENKELTSSGHTTGLPPLIVLHHILVRSPIPLPHKLHGWKEAEYVRWVDEHSEEESWSLVEGGLTHWEKVSESEGKDTSAAQEYVQLARTVLKNATAQG